MRRRFLIVLTIPLVASIGIGAGVAYGYFSSHGSGSASAAVGNLQPVTVAAVTGTAATPLIPGGTADVVLNVTNPNPVAVTLISVGANGAVTPDGQHANCTTTGVTFTSQSGLSVTIPASTTAPVDLPRAASMSVLSSNGCQGATFSVPVSITVREG